MPRCRAEGREPHPLVLFGGYGVVAVVVLALASTGSAAAMVGVGLLLAAVIALLTWWCGLPVPPHGADSESRQSGGSRSTSPGTADGAGEDHT